MNRQESLIGQRRSTTGPRAAFLALRMGLAVLAGGGTGLAHEMFDTPSAAASNENDNQNERRGKFTRDLGDFNLMKYCQERYGENSRALLTRPEIGPNVAFDNWVCTTKRGSRMINFQLVAHAQYDVRPIRARPLNPDGANTWHAFGRE